MALARYESVAVNLAGDVIPNATVDVRRDQPGRPVVPLFSDREGTVAIGNPITTDSEGKFAFHVPGGVYYIRVFTGPSQQPLQQYVRRYQAIGTAAERDVEDLASALEAGTASFRTLAELQAFTPSADEGIGGKVTTGVDAGFYHYDPLLTPGSRWVFDRPLFDTLARMNVTGGTANDIEAEIATGVADSSVVMLWIEAPATNTAPVRINTKPVLTIEDGELLPGQWMEGRTYWFSDEGAFYKLRTESDVAGLVAQVEAAAQQVADDKVETEGFRDQSEAARDLAASYAAGVQYPVSYGLPQVLTDEQKQRARSNVLAGRPWEQMFRWIASRFMGYEQRMESLERSRQRAAAKTAISAATDLGTSATVVTSLTFRATSPVMMIAANARMVNSTGGATTAYARVGISGKTAGTEIFQSLDVSGTATLSPIVLYTDLVVGTEYTVNLSCRQETATAGFNITGYLMAWSL